MSNIEWTEQTWNPIVGCSKISEGCRNCYAINQSYRNGQIALDRQAKGQKLGRLENYIGLTEKRGDRTEWAGSVRFVEDALDIPLKRKKPTMWFVNSMSDLFHQDVNPLWTKQIFDVMRKTPQHIYQVLTKRPFNLVELYSFLNPFPQNLWLGVTVENQSTADWRTTMLLQLRESVPVLFLSCEPLLEKIDFYGKLLEEIDWVIVGGESGYNCRPCNQEWIQSVVDQCIELNTPVFVKQLGGFPDKRGDFNQFPASLQYRQMPKKIDNK